MFRGKESSNRIELSRLVQDLLNFGVLGSLWLWGWGGRWMGLGGGWGVPPTHVHMHAHTCTCTHAHARVVNIIISCKWNWGNPWEFPMMSYMHACMCTWMGCTLSPLPTPIHPPPTPRGENPQNHSKLNSTWTNWDISILFEDLKSVETPPPMGGCIIWWVGGWVDGWDQVKSLKIWKLLTESR